MASSSAAADHPPHGSCATAAPPSWSLESLLEATPGTREPCLRMYRAGAIDDDPRHWDRRSLRAQAVSNAWRLQQRCALEPGRAVVLTLLEHEDLIAWFWAVVFTGRALPALLAPVSREWGGSTARARQLQALHETLHDPVWLVREQQRGPHLPPTATVLTLEALEQMDGPSPTDAVAEMPLPPLPSPSPSPSPSLSPSPSPSPSPPVPGEGPVVLLLTSGSSGAAKVVPLHAAQIEASLRGKQRFFDLTADDVVLNWIGLDHVAGLVEAHLLALHVSMDQVHVHWTDVLEEPQRWLRVASAQGATRGFAPNFFLERLAAAMDDVAPDDPRALHRLRHVVTGGEQVTVALCERLVTQLTRWGAPEDVLVPGFGMTETCAGCIYSRECPAYDRQTGQAYASLGTCMPGVQMRIAPAADAGGDGVGFLELRGAVVFAGYGPWARPQTMSDAAWRRPHVGTDGWFRTGDRARIDAAGRLHFCGRQQPTTVVDGREVDLALLETALLRARLQDVPIQRVVCFGDGDAHGRQSNHCVVVVEANLIGLGARARADLREAVERIAQNVSGLVPRVYHVPSSAMATTPMGKVARADVVQQFAAGSLEYGRLQASARRLVRLRLNTMDPMSLAQRIMACAQTVLNGYAISPSTSFVLAGLASLDTYRLLRRLRAVDELQGLTLTDLLSFDSVQALVGVAQARPWAARPATSAPARYQPVVRLAEPEQVTTTPLWLVHPGVGEVAVFLDLARALQGRTPRAVFALRARGLDTDHADWASMDEMVACYCEAVRATQPDGPYAIAGYSYGGVVAFEMAHRLQASGAEVRFVGCFNIPPFVQARMRQLTWDQCLLHLVAFLRLGRWQDVEAAAFASDLLDVKPHQQGRQTLSDQSLLLERLWPTLDPETLGVMRLTKASLHRWVGVTHGLCRLAVDYTPSTAPQRVASMDVFCGQPPVSMAMTETSWREALAQWEQFTHEPPRLHDVPGNHDVLLAAEHAPELAQLLEAAMADRGL